MSLNATGNSAGIGMHNCWVPHQSPKVAAGIAAKVSGEFGDSAITSIDDQRFRGLHGSYINGEEMIIPQDVAKYLGAGWKADKATGPNAYVLQNDPNGNSQRVNFDVKARQSTLTSVWNDNGKAHTNTITAGADGSVRNTSVVGL